MAEDEVSQQEQLLDALHQRGEQLSNILRSINAGVVVVDGSGSVVMLNDVGKTRLGLSYSPELTLADFADQFDWRDQDGIPFTKETFPISGVLSSGSPIKELPVSRGEGDDALHFSLSARPSLRASVPAPLRTSLALPDSASGDFT